MTMYFFDKAGAVVGNASSGTIALSNSAFTDVNMSTTTGATTALMRVAVTNPAMGAAQTIFLDQWQLEQGSTSSAWTIGTGVPRVCFTDSFDQSYPIFPLVSGSITLTEV